MIFMHFEGLAARVSVIAACVLRSRSYAWGIAFDLLDPELAAIYRTALRDGAGAPTPGELAARSELVARTEAAETEKERAVAELAVRTATEEAERERVVAGLLVEVKELRNMIIELRASNVVLRSYVSATRR